MIKSLSEYLRGLGKGRKGPADADPDEGPDPAARAEARARLTDFLGEAASLAEQCTEERHSVETHNSIMSWADSVEAYLGDTLDAESGARFRDLSGMTFLASVPPWTTDGNLLKGYVRNLAKLVDELG